MKKEDSSGKAASPELSVPASLRNGVKATLEKLQQEDFPKRLWNRDATLWKSDPAHQKIIRNALGWLAIPPQMREQRQAIVDFVREVRQAGFRHAVLLGMGGSSLCPDVLRATFGAAPGALDLRVLDSTVPANIIRTEKSLDLSKALFLVSSKSGGTTETLSFYKYFYAELSKWKRDKAGENFVAITDPGTSLEKLAEERSFRRVFQGAPDIGGRYSALSSFGIVPAALIGVDLDAIFDRAEQMMYACGPEVRAEDNPGLKLGAILAEAARQGRDKITFVISSGIETFADWAEQLIAESTGKDGKGLIPIAGEDLGTPADYGHDRIFVRLQLASESDEATAQKLTALEKAGHPVLHLKVESKWDLASQFYLWEVATGTVGALLGIDAFDQPNVQESKDNTRRLLEQFQSDGKLPQPPADLTASGLEFYGYNESAETGSPGPISAEALLAAFLSQAQPGDYVALMAYLERTSEIESKLNAVRITLRNVLHTATTVGFGPRFLHSTGQLHKGGPNSGLFLQLTATDYQDLPVPGERYSFSVLKQAQALGDLQSLQAKKRRVLRIHLAEGAQSGLEQLARLLEAALAKAKKAPASQSPG